MQKQQESLNTKPLEAKHLASSEFLQGLSSFLQEATSPAQAVAAMVRKLKAAGFSRINLNQGDLKQQIKSANNKYFYLGANTSLVAVHEGAASAATTGLRLVGAHTDSPCLKVKPIPEMQAHGCSQLGIEVYGGALLHTWFDRELSIAGQVFYQNSQQELTAALIDFAAPLAIIPSLAIHLNREANTNSSPNAQLHLPPILGTASKQTGFNFKHLLQQQLLKQEGIEAEIVDYDLYFYPYQSPSFVGLEQEFISSARLDNLLSCYVGLQALLNGDHQATSVLVANDHEEVGSASAVGAEGPLLMQVLRGLVNSEEEWQQMLSRSLMISCDNAHALHPNYADKHDANHGPEINAGPVIKVNANQRYATNGATSALFASFCQAAQVPVQKFVVRADMACGSTIGPISATQLGVQVVDVGAPQWAMHSARETAGTQDAWYLNLALQEFFKHSSLPVIF